MVRLETKEYVFSLNISKTPGLDTVSIGGLKGDCVNITINTPDSLAVQRGFHRLDVATIPILEWNPKCALDKDLAKGSGTISMIRTILSEVNSRYPYVNLYRFRDNSHITCDNGKELSLLHLSLVEYGQTWYERHFDAFIEDPTFYKQYKDGLQMLGDPSFKLPFTSFVDRFRPYLSQSTVDTLKPCYESSPSYFDLFRCILTTHGKGKLCVLLVGWIDLFIESIFTFDPLSLPWGIRRESIKPERATFQEFRGGRRSRKKGPMRVTIHDTYL